MEERGEGEGEARRGIKVCREQRTFLGGTGDLSVTEFSIINPHYSIGLSLVFIRQDTRQTRQIWQT
jgi:hypothetical protein